MSSVYGVAGCGDDGDVVVGKGFAVVVGDGE